MKRIIGMILGIFSVFLIGYGIHLKRQHGTAIAIIGGADGPTSIFLAGKVGGAVTNGVLIVGIVLLALFIWLLWKKKTR